MFEDLLNEKDLEVLMLAEQGEKLKIRPHMSQRVSFAVSDSKNNAYFEPKQQGHQEGLRGNHLLTPCAFKADMARRDLSNFDTYLDKDKVIDEKSTP